MAKTRMALELGMGTSLRKGDYTRAFFALLVFGEIQSAAKAFGLKNDIRSIFRLVAG